MHPLTVYDVVVREHELATEQRLREHLLALRLRERTEPETEPVRRRLRAPRTAAGEARPASSVRPAAA